MCECPRLQVGRGSRKDAVVQDFTPLHSYVVHDVSTDDDLSLMSKLGQDAVAAEGQQQAQ